MLLQQVAIVSEESAIGMSELMKVAAALQKQASRDFAPIWKVTATVSAFAKLNDVPVGYWPVIVMDNIQQSGAGGVHLDRDGQPYALVQYDAAWSLTASHETLEMLADPFGNRLCASHSVKKGQGRVEYLVEVCDPCEAPGYAYSVNGVTVSDFYTPQFFDPVKSGGTRYSFTGAIKGPREVLPGGYLSWHEPVSDTWWQLLYFSGKKTFRKLSMSGRFEGCLRSAIDRLTPRPDSSTGRGAAGGGLRAMVASHDTSEATSAKAKAWRKEIRVLLKGAVALVCAATTARAQEPVHRPPVSGMRHFHDPSLASAMSVPSPTLILQGTTTAKTATARVGFQAGDLLFDAKLTAPLDSDGDAQPADLSGLETSATLDLGLGWIWKWSPKSDPVRRQAVCEAPAAHSLVASAGCVRAAMPTAELRRRFDEAVDYGTAWLVSVRGRIGRKSFTFADSMTFARSTVQRAPFAVSAGLGYYRDKIGFVVARYRYETAYAGADAVSICRPFSAPGSLLCRDERLVGPSRSQSSFAQLEYRRLVAPAFGLKPTLTYRFASDTWGVELPLYFLRDEKGLTGGMTLGWRSDRRDLTAAVFVGGVLGAVDQP